MEDPTDTRVHGGRGEPNRVEDLHTDEGGHHDKRIPVLKKVKDKVKKIKDTLKKRNDHDNDHSSEEDAEEEEEEEQDPEIHGAPIYETEAVRDVGLVHAIEDVEEDLGAPNKRTSIPGSGPEPGLVRSFQATSIDDQAQKDKDLEASPLPTSVDMEEDPSAPTSQTATSSCIPGSYQTDVKTTNGGPEPGVIRSSTEAKQEQGKADPSDYKEKMSEAAGSANVKDTAVSAATGSSSSSSTSSIEEEDTGKGKKQQQQQDRGVSLREYLAEKLSPGEEDKALSELISGSVSTANNKKSESSHSVLAEDEKTKKKVEHQSVIGKIKGAVTSLLGGGEPKKPEGSSN